jgi:hypothetical protein
LNVSIKNDLMFLLNILMDRTQIVDLIPKYSFGHNCASNLELENTSFFTSIFQNIFNGLNKA